jgi:hypothetical protein
MIRYLSVLMLAGACALGSTAMAQEVPAAQARFQQVNQAVATLLADAENPTITSLVDLLERRSRALCQIASADIITNWLAIVSGNDEAGLTFMVGPDVNLKVINPDAEQGPFLGDLSAMQPGDQLLVSGGLVREGDACFRQEASLTADALRQPVYDFVVSTAMPLP